MKLDLNPTELSTVKEALTEYMVFLRTATQPTGETSLITEEQLLDEASPRRKEMYLAAKGLRNHLQKNQF